MHRLIWKQRRKCWNFFIENTYLEYVSPVFKQRNQIFLITICKNIQNATIAFIFFACICNTLGSVSHSELILK